MRVVQRRPTIVNEPQGRVRACWVSGYVFSEHSVLQIVTQTHKRGGQWQRPFSHRNLDTHLCEPISFISTREHTSTNTAWAAAHMEASLIRSWRKTSYLHMVYMVKVFIYSTLNSLFYKVALNWKGQQQKQHQHNTSSCYLSFIPSIIYCNLRVSLRCFVSTTVASI